MTSWNLLRLLAAVRQYRGSRTIANHYLKEQDKGVPLTFSWFISLSHSLLFLSFVICLRRLPLLLFVADNFQLRFLIINFFLVKFYLTHPLQFTFTDHTIQHCMSLASMGMFIWTTTTNKSTTTDIKINIKFCTRYGWSNLCPRHRWTAFSRKDLNFPPVLL